MISPPFLYDPGRRHLSAALRAFVDFIKTYRRLEGAPGWLRAGLGDERASAVHGGEVQRDRLLGLHAG